MDSSFLDEFDFDEIDARDADSESDNEDGEDGLFNTEAVAEPAIDDDGSFGDEERVDIADDSYSWKIDHTKGEHKLRGIPISSRIQRSMADLNM